MKRVLFIGALLMMLAPIVAHGQQLGNIEALVLSFRRIIDILIPLVAAIALLYFFWGLAKFILNAQDEEAREQGKQIMIWGIVALFVIVSVWGLVQWIGSALGVGTPQSLPIPGVGN